MPAFPAAAESPATPRPQVSGRGAELQWDAQAAQAQRRQWELGPGGEGLQSGCVHARMGAVRREGGGWRLRRNDCALSGNRTEEAALTGNGPKWEWAH